MLLLFIYLQCHFSYCLFLLGLHIYMISELLHCSMRTFAKEAIFHDHFEVSTAVMFLNWYSLTRFTCSIGTA